MKSVKKTACVAAMLLAPLGAVGCVEDVDGNYSITTLAGPSQSDVSDEEIMSFAFDLVWDEMSASDQESICDGVDIFGLSRAVEMVEAGMTDPDEKTSAAIAAKLAAEC